MSPSLPACVSWPRETRRHELRLRGDLKKSLPRPNTGRMTRITRRAFTDLAIWMLLFGLATGVVFPFFAILLGVPAAKTLTPAFVAACCGAGLLVAAINFLLARRVVGTRLRLLSGRMRAAAGRLHEADVTGRQLGDAEDAHVPVDSDDELGDTAAAFNLLVDALTRSHEALSARAATDALTGLSNHGTFHERLRSEVERAWRYQRPLSLAILDIDHFKRINDTYGHRTGDEVLVEAARLLSAMTRAGELVARTGGEEFAWILPETHAEDALQACERICRAFTRTSFPQVGLVTVSIGICDLTQAQDAGSLYGLADDALYVAKARGRNTCSLYDSALAAELGDGNARGGVRSDALAGLAALARAVDASEASTPLHSDRVAGLAVGLAAMLDWPGQRREALRQAALLHDVGKIDTVGALRSIPAQLLSDEQEALGRHPALGAEMCEGVLSPEQVAWIRSHHERWDGQGYPDGLRAGAIPDGARLLALAEGWDELTRSDPRETPRSEAEALAACVTEAGTRFCPAAVDALVQVSRAGLLRLVEASAPEGSPVTDRGSGKRSPTRPLTLENTAAAADPVEG